MPKALMLVWSDPSGPAREEEYNTWYDSQHIPDVLAIPGFHACTRYKVSDAQFGAVDTPASYLAVYEVDADDLSTIPQQMGEAFAAGKLPTSDVITPGAIVILEQKSIRIAE